MRRHGVILAQPTSPRTGPHVRLSSCRSVHVRSHLGLSLRGSATADEVPAEGSPSTTGRAFCVEFCRNHGCLSRIRHHQHVENTARVVLPLVAKAGTANAAAGGFRFLNTESGESFRCSNPTIDTRARVIDCVLPSGYNSTVFAITDINARAKADTDSTKTTLFQGMRIQIINREMANRLNQELTRTFFLECDHGSGLTSCHT